MKYAGTPILFALLLVTGSCAYLDGNLRIVEDGRMYRSGQLASTHLERTIKKHNIRTVVSLRQPNLEESWYQNEVDVCEDLGVRHIDLPMSKEQLPLPAQVQALSAIFEDEGPVLVHCQGGTHRSGVAAALYVLSQGGTPAQAREQFLLFFNDAPIGGIIDVYEASHLPFDEWLRSGYPTWYEANVETAEQD